MKRIKRVPTILQMEAVECGAASLAMILAYYGTYKPLEQLRVICGVSRDGSKASNILKAARGFGLEAKGYRKEPASLKSMPLPMIIHWDFCHFLVLEGFHKGQVHLNDPAAGRRVVSEEEFNNSFTGIVMTFQLTPDFVKDARRPSIVDSLRTRLQGSETALAYVFLVGLALVIPGLVIPVFSRIFVDDILLDSRDSWLVPLLLGMGLTALLRTLLTGLQRFYLLRLEAKLSLSASTQFFWHIFKLPTEFFSQRSAGEITSRIQSNDNVARVISGKLVTVSLNLVMIAFYFILMVVYQPLLASVGLVIAVLNVLYLRFASQKRMDQNRRLLKDRGRALGTGFSGLQIIETLKATGTESDFFAKWAGYQGKYLNSQQDLGLSSQLLTVLPVFLTGINNGAILVLGGFLIMEGSFTIGMLVAFQSLMSSFLSPVTELVGLSKDFQEAEGEMSRLDDVLRYPVAKQEADLEADEPTDAGKTLKGYIQLRNLSFGYSQLEPPLIEDLSIAVRPGDRVALVGGSGSGKSTVAKLIAGIHQPWAGEILFDGESRSFYPAAVIHNTLAMVDQEITMFEGSIRDNLTLWDETVSEFSLIRAAKDACIHQDITARPGGYDSAVEEGGKNFSGGQRQRLEIARALVQNPRIIILDEATSALDPLTEKQVDENIRHRGCTCIIVAHRLSTIRDCDEIIVLQNGKIVERGTHDNLQQLNNVYAGLIQTH